MGRRLEEVVASLPLDQRERIEARYQELKLEVEGLRELRELAGKAQADIATALNIKQPSVSKIENQTDMYLSTLRRYVEAIGGELELTVKLPERPVLRIHHFGEVGARGAEPPSAPPVRRRRAAAVHQATSHGRRISRGAKDGD